VLSACSGEQEQGAAEGEDTGAGAPEQAQITVGVLPIVDVAPVQIAIDEGLFAAEGLTVTTEVLQGGAAAVPALVSGDLDVAFGAWPSMLQATTQGIALRAIADGVRAAPGFALIMATDPALEGNPAGLEGRAVAVNTLDNLGELAVRSSVRQGGGDDAAVAPIEVPFPQMIQTLERGDVDAIWATEPFATVAQNTLPDVVTVTDSYTGPMDGFPVAGYQVTADFAESNPNTVAAFQRAITAASQRASEEPDLLRATVLASTEIEESVVDQISYPQYVGTPLDPATLQRVADYAVQFGILSQPLDAADLVVAPPS
jgi:NitT/TauT family transport system substrate-binding protein